MTNDLERVGQNNDIKRTYYKSNRLMDKLKLHALNYFTLYLTLILTFHMKTSEKRSESCKFSLTHWLMRA